MKLDWKDELGKIRLLGPDIPVFNEAVQKIWDYIDHFEKHRRDWPSDLHEQYLKILDERDKLQRDVDIYQKILDDMPTDDLFEIYEEEYKEQYGEDA